MQHPLLKSLGNKPRKGTVKICKMCGREYYSRPCYINKTFCSKACANKGLIKNTPVALKCKTCGNEYHTPPSQIKWRGSGYCSNKCKWESYKAKIGEKHHTWKGENASYSPKHRWIRARKGSAKSCSKCGSNNHVQWSNVDHKYKRDLCDYVALCIKCHCEYDKLLKKQNVGTQKQTRQM
jgi:hypothetical protein